MEIRSYKDLIVWQRGMTLVELIYIVTKKLPASEQWGLISQMRSAVVSIPSNIAEGYGRQSTGSYRQFLAIR
jgi:four helix bundle protein